jgi:hypothetical protein
MKKDFLTITPESGGGGTASVSAVADPNLLAKERSTTINFSATGGGGLSRAVTAIQDPAFVYHILSNLCNFEDSANSGYKVENGIFVIPLQWQDTHFKLKVFNPFSVITSVTAKYSDEFGIGESLGDDTFSKDGLVWIPTNLENWRNELPNEPSTMKVELYFNGTLAVRMSK